MAGTRMARSSRFDFAARVRVSMTGYLQKVVPESIDRCSTTGPRARDGRKVRPPVIRITPTTRPTNRPPSVGKVPADVGTIFLVASDPAMASIGTIIRKRPMNIARPRVEFQNGVLADSPAKALPLLPVAEV